MLRDGHDDHRNHSFFQCGEIAAGSNGGLVYLKPTAAPRYGVRWASVSRIVPPGFWHSTRRVSFSALSTTAVRAAGADRGGHVGDRALVGALRIVRADGRVELVVAAPRQERHVGDLVGGLVRGAPDGDGVACRDPAGHLDHVVGAGHRWEPAVVEEGRRRRRHCVRGTSGECDPPSNPVICSCLPARRATRQHRGRVLL